MVIAGCLDGDTKISLSTKSDISDIEITEKIHKQEVSINKFKGHHRMTSSTDLKIRKELDSLKYDLKE